MFSLTIFFLLGLLLLGDALRRTLSSPLNKIPGPWYAKFTSVVLKWHEFQARRTTYVHALHLRYGPAVRIAPNEVAFASAAAVKEIYCSGGSGYDKTEFYDLFRVYGRRTMFTTLNKENVSSVPLSLVVPDEPEGRRLIRRGMCSMPRGSASWPIDMPTPTS